MDLHQSTDNFKPLFKYYKQKVERPSFNEIVDFSKSGAGADVASHTFHLPCNVDHLGLKACKKWEVLEAVPGSGLYFICNPFTDTGQKMWSRRCLEVYSKQPNKTNLHKLDNLTLNINTLWEASCKEIKSCHKEAFTSNSEQVGFLKSLPIWKLRWSTLGYHHDWDTKLYTESNRSVFPDDLNELSKLFAEAVGRSNYNAEAAIINFYHVGSTLSPHTDHSEQDLAAPLVSISFGLPAIFLIGGKTKAQKPTALVIRPGDVVIMTAESRLAYHAVPRILDCETKAERTDPLELFLAHSRINMNIRQVNTPESSQLSR